MKLWVDVPSGWRYGFPKLYDPEHDGDMSAWIYRNGYPHDKEILYTRQWEAREEERDEN